MPFNEEECDLCGLCLQKCPALELSPEEAEKEMRSLINGEETDYVLDNCNTCFSCNAICPNDCDPYSLILSRWFERYKKEGLPEHMSFMLPFESPSFFTLSKEMLPQDEKETVKVWEKRANNISDFDEIFFASCNTRLIPYITFTDLLEDIPIVGSQNMCCGEVYYRMGIWDVAEKNAERLKRKYQGLDRMVTMCPACYNMFKNEFPSQYDVNFDFEMEHLLEYLWERIEKGQIELGEWSDKTVTVHDSCHAKVLGDDFMEMPRKILDEVGAEIIEMEHNKKTGLCCGIGGGAPSHSVLDLMEATMERWTEARKTGADCLIVYCNTCLLLLSIMKKLTLSRMPIYHILEIIQLATGEEPAHRHSQRAGQAIKGTVLKGLPKIFSRGKFWPDI